MGRRRENKKQKQRQAFVTWFLVGLMIFSLAGVFLGSTTGDSGPTGLSLDYEGQKFDISGQYYSTKVDGVEKKFVKIEGMEHGVTFEDYTSLMTAETLFLQQLTWEMAYFKYATTLRKRICYGVFHLTINYLF